MFNKFVSDHRQQVSERRRRDILRQTKWRNRYETNRDNLAVKYERRVENFVFRMQENPIPIKLQQQQSKLRETGQFKFKDTNDWNSIYTPIERAQKTREIDRSRKAHSRLPEEMVNRSLASQSAYETFHIGYRSRQKSKQIQSAMRFNYIPVILKKTTAPSLQQKTVPAQLDTEEQDYQMKRRLTNSSASYDQDLVSLASRKLPTVRNFSNNNKSNAHQSSFENSQRRRHTTMGASSDEDPYDPSQSKPLRPVDPKLHFKAAMELAATNKNMSKVARYALQKCKLVRFKHTEAEVQKDLFQQLRQEAQHVNPY